MAKQIVNIKARTIQNHYSTDALSDKFFVFDTYSDDKENLNGLVVTDFPVRLDILIAIICEEGTLSLNVGYANYVIRKNDFINVFPNGVFQVVEVSNDFRAKIICIEPGFFDFDNEQYDFGAVNILKEYPCQSLPAPKMELICFLLNYIRGVIQETSNIHRKSIIFNVLKIISYEVLNLVLADNENKKERSCPNAEVVNKFRKEIELNFQKERTVKYYADKAFLTPKYFAAMIFRLTDKRAKDWIDEYTIMAAKAMLKSSYLTIQQISYELNFATPSHFGRYFKHHTKVSPLQYRNS